MSAMTFSLRLPSLHLPSLRRRPKYDRRPRIIADRKARAALSRDNRWKRRSGSGGLGKWIIGLLCIGGAAVAVLTLYPARAPLAPQSPFPEFVTRAEATFPEAFRGYSWAWPGQLSDGSEVPVAISLMLPSRMLVSAAASPDALTRLSAPFVGAERAISGAEMGARIAQLADEALPATVTRCYTYATGTPRRIALSETRDVNAVQIDIAFNPEC